MKKIYSLIAATAIVFSVNAQRTARQAGDAHPLNGFTPAVKHTATSRVAGDSLFYFDGNTFRGTGIDGTFAYGNDDLDGLTVWTAGQTSFGVTSAWRFFYSLNSVTSDTNFFMGATSYFTTDPDQADNWFEVGPITIPAAGATLSWKHNMPDGAFRDGYNVLVSGTGLANYTDFVDPPIYVVTDNDPSTALDTVNFPDNVFAPRAVSLTPYAGTSIYIAFQHHAFGQFILYLDDILVTENSSTTGIAEFTNGVKVFQNMPNPFSTTSTVNYELEKAAPVVLSVYDVTGKKVAEQNEGTQSEGQHSLKFNGESLSAGVYYYSLTVGQNATSTMKMVIVK